jgi:hypothetical protein
MITERDEAREEGKNKMVRILVAHSKELRYYSVIARSFC